ncbi:penicillin-binding transpeptidase domain-containing protein [Actinomadura sp. NPDC049753]|uniref:penicillin-binding transpeptidase domain-containing protein n=1 Tax=Actinomadura sp. NPDC049753 TaxID=3154739 RepID=UPI003447F575
MIEPSRLLRLRLGAAVLAALPLFGTAACGAAAHEAVPRGAAAVATPGTVRPGMTVRDDLRAVFDAAGVRGSFALLDVTARHTIVVDRRRAEKAVRISNAAAFQVIARRVGLQRERQWLHRLGYGNRQTGTTVDRFWLDGPLKISAVEQTRFMERLAAERLPASRANQRTVRDLIKQEEKDGYALYAKSGWQNAPDPGTGWWAGWVEHGGRVHTFALNIDIAKDGDAGKRATVARELLKRLSALPTA